MLIRSQDKLNLININNSNITTNVYFAPESKLYPCYIIDCPFGTLGIYSSKEIAIKVLDMIEEECQIPTYINDEGGREYAKYNNKIFHMPKDNEVII